MSNEIDMLARPNRPVVALDACEHEGLFRGYARAMHAVVVTVSIAAGQFESSRKTLHENVVPQVSKAPGFVKGYWAAALDARSGLSLVVFKTKPDAENAAAMVRSNP